MIPLFQRSRLARLFRTMRFSHYPYISTHSERAGFTLIETLVAVTLLTVAIIAPMTLTTKSLAAAYYARDQITAFHLAQEAIEALRHRRDANILRIAKGGEQVNMLDGLLEYADGKPFTIDTIDEAMSHCDKTCVTIKKRINGSPLYGYGGSGWMDTRFTRSVTMEPLGGDELRITVVVSWQTGSFQTRDVEISANLYRWVNDASSQI